MTKIRFNENQLPLPFGQAAVANLPQEARERMFWSMTAICIMSLAIYIFAVNAAAHHIAMRQNLEKQVAEASANLSTLEFSAIAMRNAVTIDVAHQYGFKEVDKPLYVSRADTAGTLTFNTITR